VSGYSDHWSYHLPRASVTVHENPREGTVTYRNEQGDKFRVRVVQKANPIGFGARLPGDKR
jgi:hypothetical protein